MHRSPRRSRPRQLSTSTFVAPTDLDFYGVLTVHPHTLTRYLRTLPRCQRTANAADRGVKKSSGSDRKGQRGASLALSRRSMARGWRLSSYVGRGVHRAHRGGVRAARAGPARGGEVVTANLIGLVLAVGVAVYLVAALLFPERF
ncbi:K(+)-transporting ATPase subunit F [Nocardia abscessus]|uniref:K(+)-transporting ATPase subunit F n=2 Tax=Nocardia abscessus TaxID=120957 RepID=UPI003CC7E403